MEQYAQNIMCTDEEKVITYCKNIIKAVDKTRDVAAQSKLKSRKIKDALQTKDKQTMWNVLQEYIHKHGPIRISSSRREIAPISSRPVPKPIPVIR